MAEDRFKPEARCKYNSQCALYSNGVLQTEVENTMCGRGEKADKNYEPSIPVPNEFKPTEHYAHGPGNQICDGFLYFVDHEFLASIEKKVDGISKIFEKHKYW